MSAQSVHIEPNSGVNGLNFGCSTRHLWEVLGEPARALENYTGELELLYDNYFMRCFEDRLVECTFPADCQFWIEGARVLSVQDWLRGQPDCVERAKFLISLKAGMAYDMRNPVAASVTVFEPGRWDALLADHPE